MFSILFFVPQNHSNRRAQINRNGWGAGGIENQNVNQNVNQNENVLAQGPFLTKESRTSIRKLDSQSGFNQTNLFFNQLTAIAFSVLCDLHEVVSCLTSADINAVSVCSVKVCEHLVIHFLALHIVD